MRLVPIECRGGACFPLRDKLARRNHFRGGRIWGALLLLPVLTGVLGVKAAVPVLTIMQLLGNLSRVWFGRTQIAWKPIGYFLLGALQLIFVA